MKTLEYQIYIPMNAIKYDYYLTYRIKDKKSEIDRINERFQIDFIRDPMRGYPFYNFEHLKVFDIE